MDEAAFLMIGCQVGAEAPCKAVMAKQWPSLRLSFSRPGFLTYKADQPAALTPGLELRNPFARTRCAFLTRLSGGDAGELASQFWQVVAEQSFSDAPLSDVHIWRRDLTSEVETSSPLIEAEREAIREIRRSRPRRRSGCRLNRATRANAEVVDCVLVEADTWWIGRHRAGAVHLRWPGGVPPLKRPEKLISRAYLKMREALWWSRLPVKKGDQCIEVGSAPGGAAQALLELGLQVVGIDPAEMDPSVAEHPNFTHIRKRGREVRKSRLTGARWLFADANVAPEQILATLEEIVTHGDVHVQGLLVNLKLPDWRSADRLPEHLERIRGWGFRHVRPRQLAFNRREICVLAVRRKAILHAPPGKASKQKRRANA